jgi:hypothetical protein
VLRRRLSFSGSGSVVAAAAISPRPIARKGSHAFVPSSAKPNSQGETASRSPSPPSAIKWLRIGISLASTPPS